jgi:type 1 glutamine amidotransferase
MTDDTHDVLTNAEHPDRRPHAVILSGSGRFADPWHPFAETSASVAQILETDGFTTEIAGVDERMSDLSGADLVVVNIGAPSTPDLEQDTAVHRGLLEYVDTGGPLLVLHVSSTSLPSVPEWESIIGGLWVRGTTMHPDYGLAHLEVYPDRHPIVATTTDFDLYDERYSYLRVASEVVPLAAHRHDGIDHPILWARTYESPAGTGGVEKPTHVSRVPARVVYDALGHDARSYDSAEHREIIRRSARWLLGDLEG